MGQNSSENIIAEKSTDAYMKARPTIPRPTTTTFLRPSAILATGNCLPTPGHGVKRKIELKYR
jgi:hypothetical protein